MFHRALVASGIIILVLLGLIAGMLVACVSTPISPTLPPPSPTATLIVQPAIRLDPPSGPPATTVTIQGSGWPPDAPVRIFAGLSQAEALQSASWQEVVPDATGQFRTEIMAPLFEVWDRAVDWFVVARSKDNRFDAYGVFAIPNPDPRTATPKPTATLLTPTPESVRLEGSVQALDLASRTLGIRTSDGRPFLVTLGEGAELVDLEGHSAALADITLGTKAVVEGFVSPGGVVNATRVILSLLVPTVTPTVIATPTLVEGWRVRYFDNDSLLGTPVLEQVEPSVDVDWMHGSPDPRIPVDHFSARWTRTLAFKTGGYRFYARADDGVRVWLNDSLLIDQWREAPTTTYEVESYLAAGQYSIKIDYFEAEGEARVRFWWEPITTYADWKGEYYNNMSLTGDPSFVRNDSEIAFDWGDGAPAPGINADRFSVRWKRVRSFEPGTYRFFARADDGIRVWVAGSNIMDEWHDSDGLTYEAEVSLLAQSYEIVVEYYDNGGRAQVHFWWENLTDQTPTPTRTSSPTATPTLLPGSATPTATRITPGPTPTMTATGSPQGLPDLTIRSVRIELETAGVCFNPGDSLGLRVEVQNTGTGNAGAFIVESNGERRDVPDGLGPGQAVSLWFAAYRYPDMNIVLVDVASQVAESNEDNNVFAQPVPIPTPPPPCSTTPGA